MIVGPHGFGFITGFSGKATASYADEVNADSPLIYYRFEETSGTPVDETGFSSISSTKGSPDLNQSGLNSELGSAVRFDGDAWYVLDKTSGDLGVDSSNSRTIEVWGYPESFNKSGAFWDLGGNGGTTGEDFTLRVLDSDDSYRFQIWGSDDQDFSASGTKNQWNHYVITHSSSGELEIWVNKTKVVSTTVSLSTRSNPINIGRWENDSTGIVGRVDEFAVYDKVLSDSRIQAHYDAGVGN